MKKRILSLALLFILLFIAVPGMAQITLIPTDTALCPGQTYTIYGSFGTEFTASLNVDDNFGNNIIDIGFPFVFYGDTVTQCVLSDNNFITFDLSWVGLFSNYIYSMALNGGELDDAVMFPFQEADPAGVPTAVISSQTFGSAPNRKFVVEFCSVPLFGCANDLVTNEVILYEGSNIIEMHITNEPTGCFFASGTAVEGLRHNGQEDLVPGRDVPNVDWGAVNDARRFTPNGTTGYTIDTIPYDPIKIIHNADSNSIVWYEEGNPTPIHTGPHVTVTVSPNIDYYVAKISGQSCNDTGIVTYTDTSWLHYNTQYDTFNISICQGETYDFFGAPLSQPGTYDTLLSTVGGCDSSIRINLEVNPLPDVTLTDSAVNQIICFGGQTNFSLQSPYPGYSYQWERNGIIMPADTNASVTAESPGDYQLIVTTKKGCVDSSHVIHLKLDTVGIAFNPLLLPGCTEDTVQIVNNSDSGISYKWYFGDGTYPPDTVRNPRHIYENQGTYQIRLVMTDNYGCTDSMVKIIKFDHPLIADFSVDRDSICQGDNPTVEFTNNSVGAQFYEWNFADGSPETNVVNPSHDYIRAGNHLAMLIASDSLSCEDTAYHLIYIDSVAPITLNVSKTHLCTGEKLYLNLAYRSSNAITVNWYFGDDTHWTDTAASATHSFDNPGSYQVIVSVDYPVCPNAADSVQIQVYRPPLVNLGQDTVLCLQGSPITLKNLDDNPPLTQYKWNTGASGNTIKVVHPGLYALTATLFDCSTTEHVMVRKDCYVDIPNAFSPNGDGNNDYFFPRKYLSNGVSGFVMSIYNRWGEKIFETKNSKGRGWDGRFNGKPQPAGVYVYTIEVVYHNLKAERYTGNVTLLR